MMRYCVHFLRIGSCNLYRNYTKSPYYLNHLENSLAISNIVDLVIEDLQPQDAIIEAYPGLGDVTFPLLNKTRQNTKFILFEPDYSQRLKLTTFLEPFKERTVISPIDPFLVNLDKSFPQLNTFNGVKNIRYIAPVMSNRILPKLTLDYGLVRNNLYAGFHPIFYFYIQEFGLTKTRTPELYFDFETYGTVSLDEMDNLGKKVGNNYLLVKASPRTNLIDQFNEVEFMYLYNFANRVLIPKSGSLLSWFETHIPDSGKDFIKEGLKTFIPALKLSNDELIRMFKIFINHPRFSQSFFKEDSNIRYLTMVNKTRKE